MLKTENKAACRQLLAMQDIVSTTLGSDVLIGN